MSGITRRQSTADVLEERAPELCAEALRDMYADPFWEARFGARGRRFAREDAHFHVGYLAEALRAGTAAPFVMYVRWLQSVLTTRGMCTLHLRDMLEALARSIGASDVRDVETAVAYLQVGTAALRRDGEAGRIEQLPVRDTDDRIAAHLASYLGDAVALRMPRVFVEHLQWLRANADRVHATPARVEEALAALLAALAAAEPPIEAADQIVATIPAAA